MIPQKIPKNKLSIILLIFFIAFLFLILQIYQDDFADFISYQQKFWKYENVNIFCVILGKKLFHIKILLHIVR